MISTDARTDNLNDSDARALVGWFIYRMPQEQRHRLMAELPQLYCKLFPGVSTGVIESAVAAALDSQQQSRISADAAALGFEIDRSEKAAP